MIKFANFEFIFAIRGPKLAWRGVVDKLIKHKIGGPFFTCIPGMTLGRRARGQFTLTMIPTGRVNSPPLLVFEGKV